VRFRKRLVARTSLILISALVSSVAEAGRFPIRYCAASFKPVEKTAAPSLISKADPAKSRMLEDAPVKDQGDIGCCWVETPTAEWERLATKHFGETVKIDANYSIMANLDYRIKEALYYGITIDDGGISEAADWMATHIGFVPEGVVRWKTDFTAKGVAERLYMELNGEIAQFQTDLAKMYARGAGEDEVWKFANDKRAAMMKKIRDQFADFPSHFEFKGKNYTPNSFAKEVGATEKDWVRHEYTLPDPDRDRLPRYQGEDDPPTNGEITEARALFGLYPDIWKKLPGSKSLKNGTPDDIVMRYLLFARSRAAEFASSQVNYERMYEAIDDSLKRGVGVYLGFDVIRKFFNNETGVISLAANKAGAAEIRAAKSDGGHAVLVTGIYRDVESKVVGFRIQNSWGTRAGNNGYYYMDRDYFEVYMRTIVIREPPSPTQTGTKTFRRRAPKPFRPTDAQRPNAAPGS